jgi:hypothetical protein
MRLDYISITYIVVAFLNIMHGLLLRTHSFSYVYRGRKHYVYTVKDVYKKGGNRWCTQMYFAIKAIKWSGNNLPPPPPPITPLP